MSTLPYRQLHSTTDRTTMRRTIIRVSGKAPFGRIWLRQVYQLDRDAPANADPPLLTSAYGIEAGMYPYATEEEALAALATMPDPTDTL